MTVFQVLSLLELCYER